MKKVIVLVILLIGLVFSKCEYYDSFYSSFIESAVYCPTSDYNGILTLTLNGSDYDYYISYETWLGFKNASSKGSYFNHYIK